MKSLQSFATKSLYSRKISNLINEVHVLNDDMFRLIVKLGKKVVQLEQECIKEDITVGMIEKELPFSWRHAKNIIQVSQSPILMDKKYKKRLPPSIGTLIQLVKMHKERPRLFLTAWNEKKKEKDGQNRITDYLINPEMTRQQIIAFREANVNGQTTKKLNKRNEITYNMAITFKKDISSAYLKKKLKELEKIAEKDFRIDITSSPLQKHLK